MENVRFVSGAQSEPQVQSGTQSSRLKRLANPVFAGRKRGSTALHPGLVFYNHSIPIINPFMTIK